MTIRGLFSLSSLRTITAGRGYFLLLCGALAVALWLQRSELSPAMGSGLVVLGVGVLIAGLERLTPHRRDWRPSKRVLRLDALHTLVSSMGVAPLVRIGLVASAASLATVAGERGLGIWPNHWPLLLQLALAIPLADFGVYWAHRFMHQTTLGWRIHAIHHSPTQLYFMASARSHPLNAAITVSCQAGMLLLWGIGPEALSLWAVFLAVNGLLQHANIAFQPRLVSRVLATCDVHRAHHSIAHAGCNYGNMTMIWDQIFGTYAAAPREAEDVGAAGYRIPEGYISHLVAPFTLRKLEEECASSGGK